MSITYFGQIRPQRQKGLPLDRYIHENYIKKRFNDGTFLELGALNGRRFSNTKFFEDNMGFNQGVLIEPDPKSFTQLVKNRPKCECFNYAIHTEHKSVSFLTGGNSAMNCVDHSEAKTHIKDFHKRPGWGISSTVPAERLDVILQKTKLEYLDFWSLDVEGSELQCLNSMDWSIPIGLVVIETTANKEQIDNIMIKHGFSFMEQLYSDTIYFNLNYFRRNLFSIKE